MSPAASTLGRVCTTSGRASDGRGITRALEEWGSMLGAERVRVDQPTLDRYGRTTLACAPSPRAVVRPQRADQLPALLRVARDHALSVYPISRGRNWGWGEACPVTAGQIVIDLGDLDRIVEINAELGYAVIEPGVTQGQLVHALAAAAPQWWLESTNAGADTSIVGNTLERGLGSGDRMNALCGLEVVLADGQMLRTGFGMFPRSRVTHVAKWGLGPNLEGLFSQSNLGVVTRMGIWLAPRPRGAECCLVSVAGPELPHLLDALRPLRLCGTLPTNVHVFPVLGRDGDKRWLAVGVTHGSDALRAAHRDEIREALGPVGRRLHFETEPRDIGRALASLELRATPGVDDLFRAGAALCRGEPFSPGAKFLLAYLGGPEVQRTSPEPQSADPLDNAYGFYFLWATCPATGRDVSEAIRLVEKAGAAFGLRPQLTIQLPNGRAAVLVVRICYSRRDGDARARASGCYRATLRATVDAGFPPWRLGIEGMSLLGEDGVDTALARRLKRSLDPESVLAPGRYDGS